MKSDPIQGIIFQEKTMQPVKPVVRLRRSIARIPRKIREVHHTPVNNPGAPVTSLQTTELLGRLRTK